MMLRNAIALCITLGIIVVAIGCDEIAAPQATPTPEHPFWHVKRLAKRATFEELYRYNERYQGYQVYLEGRVVQVIADGNSDRYELLVAMTRVTPKYSNMPSLERYENPVLVNYTGPVRLLKDDLVEMVGTVKGLYTYETVSGSSKTVPEITEARIQLTN